MAKIKKIKKAPRSIRKMFSQVTTVIDAKTPIEVHVKESDCKSAEPLNPQECALARATKREFKADAVVIGIAASYIIKGKKAIRFRTTGPIQREIVSFDRHSDFQPGDYNLVPVSPSNRFGVHTKLYPPAKYKGEKRRKRNREESNKNRTHEAKRSVIHKTTKIREFSGSQ